MYWFLSSLPLLLGLFWDIYGYFDGFVNANSIIINGLMWCGVLVLTPIYLLCVNIFYLNKYIISYMTGIINMIGVIVARVGIGLLFHKIKYGTFIGDVPEGIYYTLIFVPSIIVVVGLLAYWMIKDGKK